jgi:hypothetical protein
MNVAQRQEKLGHNALIVLRYQCRRKSLNTWLRFVVLTAKKLQLPNTRNWLLLSLLIIPSWTKHSSHFCDTSTYTTVYLCFICRKISGSNLVLVIILWRISWFSSVPLNNTENFSVHNRILPGRCFSLSHIFLSLDSVQSPCSLQSMS